MTTPNEAHYFPIFKASLNSYASLSEHTWEKIKSFVKFRSIQKGEYLLQEGETAQSIHFVCKGLLRAFYIDLQGNAYNKIFFLEGGYAASTVSLLKNSASDFNIEALEDTLLIDINFARYRQLIQETVDFKNFHIAYIERNWIIKKEEREIAFVTQTASERYVQLITSNPSLEKRISQHHIASHLGITPTQLSRIRKELKTKKII